jgi:hypothetical protein
MYASYGFSPPTGRCFSPPSSPAKLTAGSLVYASLVYGGLYTSGSLVIQLRRLLSTTKKPNIFYTKLTTQTNSNLSFGRLRNFINFNSLRRSDCLGQMVIQLCVSLYSLCITEKELLNTDLLRFVGHLKELRYLILNKETSKEDSNDILTDKSLLFHYKLVPILEIIGASLESLHVEISVDISVIIRLCPNLTYLSLYETHCISNKDLSIMT